MIQKSVQIFEFVIRHPKDISNIALYHTILQPSSNDHRYFNIEESPLAQGIETIKTLLILLNSLFSSSQTINYIKNYY